MAVVNPDSMLTQLGSNIAFLKDWSVKNEEKFAQVMDLLAEEKPDRWADLFLRVQDKIAPPKETKNSTTINVKVSSDMDKLKALSDVVDARPRIEKQNDYTAYEELK